MEVGGITGTSLGVSAAGSVSGFFPPVKIRQARSATPPMSSNGGAAAAIAGPSVVRMGSVCLAFIFLFGFISGDRMLGHSGCLMAFQLKRE